MDNRSLWKFIILITFLIVVVICAIITSGSRLGIWDFTIRTFRHKRTEGIVFGCEDQKIPNTEDFLFLCRPRKHRFGYS